MHLTLGYLLVNGWHVTFAVLQDSNHERLLAFAFQCDFMTTNQLFNDRLDIICSFIHDAKQMNITE